MHGVQVFSATKYADRESLGEKATAWIARNPHLDVVRHMVVQSSDATYHCLTIVICWKWKILPSVSQAER